MNIIEMLNAEEVQRLTADKTIPEFQPGDTVVVNVKVKEGERSRVQAYEGVCIARTGGGLQESFTVRKISYGEGVERVFPVFSPNIDSIKVIRRGAVRRAKLYYLRGPSRQVGPYHGARRQQGQEQIQGQARQGDGGRITPPFHSIGDRPGRSRLVCPTGRRCGTVMGTTMVETASPVPTTLYDKIWDDHVRRPPAGRHLPPLHRSPSRPRGDEPAGIRRPADHGASRSSARQDPGGRRSQRADHGPARRHPGTREPHAGRDAGRERPPVRHRIFRRARPSPGYRPTSSDRNRGSRCPGPRSCAATATPRRMAPSGLWRMASGPAKSSTCWPRRR